MRAWAGILVVVLAACDGGKDPVDDTDVTDDTDDTDDTDPLVDDSDPGPDDTDDSDPGPDDTDDSDPVADDTDDTDPVVDDTDDSDVLTDDTDVPLDTDDSDVPVDTADVFDADIATILAGGFPVGTRVALEDVSYVARRGVGAIVIGEAPGGPGHLIEVITPPGWNARLEKELEIEAVVSTAAGPAGPRYVLDASAAPFFVTELLNYTVIQPWRASLPDLLDPAGHPELADVLVELAPARVYDVVLPFDWSIGDYTGSLYTSGEQAWPGALAYGDTFDSLAGVVTWRNGRYELVPRRPADFGTLATAATPADQLRRGELVISEIMAQGTTGPGGVSCTAPGTLGDYVELANTTGQDLDLDGLYVYNLVTNDFLQVRRPAPLAAGGRVVVWTSRTPCYGLPVALTLAQSLRFGFSAPWVGLFNNTVDLDMLWLSGFTTTPGTALELSEGALDPALNDDPGRWCDATAGLVAGSPDLGTPGAVNDCP